MTQFWVVVETDPEDNRPKHHVCGVYGLFQTEAAAKKCREDLLRDYPNGEFDWTVIQVTMLGGQTR